MAIRSDCFHFESCSVSSGNHFLHDTQNKLFLFDYKPKEKLISRNKEMVIEILSFSYRNGKIVICIIFWLDIHNTGTIWFNYVFCIIHLIFKFSVFAQIFLTFYSALNGNRENAQVYEDLYFLWIICYVSYFQIIYPDKGEFKGPMILFLHKQILRHDIQGKK